MRAYRGSTPASRRRVLYLLLPLLCAACASGPESGEPARKSVLVGELLAIFPGFFVHGLGHRYAGNVERADEILLMEAFSVLTLGLGGGLVAIGESEDAEAVEIAGWVGIAVGAIPFLGTWVYDIVYTPAEVREHNRRVAAGE